MQVAVKNDIDLTPIPISNETSENMTEISKEPENFVDPSNP